MKLIGILQGVSLEGEIQNYLDFLRDDGSPFRLPVPEETIKLVIAEIYREQPARQAKERVEEEAPEVPQEEHYAQGATEFGGEEPEPEQEEPYQEEPEAPRSESEVPSL
jgi:hypothetical protein